MNLILIFIITLIISLYIVRKNEIAFLLIICIFVPITGLYTCSELIKKDHAENIKNKKKNKEFYLKYGPQKLSTNDIGCIKYKYIDAIYYECPTKLIIEENHYKQVDKSMVNSKEIYPIITK